MNASATSHKQYVERYYRDRGTLRPRFVREDGSMVFNWGEASFHLSGPALKLAQHHHEGHTLIIGLIWLTLYIATPKFFDWEVFEGGLGFAFTEDSLQLHWGKKTTVHWYPWDFNFYRRWERVAKLNWDSDGFVEMPRNACHGTVATKEVHPFEYVLKSGEVQKRTATVYVDRMEWRRRGLLGLPWFNKVRTYINVSFDGEVGERTWSWKGGCVGCSYDMLPGETAKQTLDRMARERKFT